MKLALLSPDDYPGCGVLSGDVINQFQSLTQQEVNVLVIDLIYSATAVAKMVPDFIHSARTSQLCTQRGVNFKNIL